MLFRARKSDNWKSNNYGKIKEGKKIMSDSFTREKSNIAIAKLEN